MNSELRLDQPVRGYGLPSTLHSPHPTAPPYVRLHLLSQTPVHQYIVPTSGPEVYECDLLKFWLFGCLGLKRHQQKLCQRFGTLALSVPGCLVPGLGVPSVKYAGSGAMRKTSRTPYACYDTFLFAMEAHKLPLRTLRFRFP